MRIKTNRDFVLHVLLYGVAFAAVAFFLDWIDFRHAMRVWSSEFYVTVVALVFAGLGVWLGNRLTPRKQESTFEKNEPAIDELTISPRELEVLEELADGSSNKVIAQRLKISPNTVKTHLARLLEKLEASNRTEAISKARALRILP
jgi:DNA-binding NarL/FixJ family response regulator